MNKKVMLSIAAFAIFAMSANNVFASTGCELPMQKRQPQNGCNNFGQSPFNMSPKTMEKMKKEHENRKAEMDTRLKLTDEQKCVIEKSREDARQKMKPVYEEMKAKKMKLNELGVSGLSQEEKEKQIKSLKVEINDLRMKSHSLREENMKNFESVLTPSQKNEFEKMQQERKKEMKKRSKGHKRPITSSSYKN